MIARLALAVLAAAAAGCAAGPRVNRDEMFVRSVLDSAAQQVQRCYRFPRVSHEGRQIITRLRVRVQPDGSLGGLPEVVEQTAVTPANRIQAQAMAAAAINAVLGCAPLRLPSDVYFQGSVEIDLVFAPLARA